MVEYLIFVRFLKIIYLHRMIFRLWIDSVVDWIRKPLNFYEMHVYVLSINVEQAMINEAMKWCYIVSNSQFHSFCITTKVTSIILSFILCFWMALRRKHFVRPSIVQFTAVQCVIILNFEESKTSYYDVC